MSKMISKKLNKETVQNSCYGISIITIVLNGVSLIDETIQSVINQKNINLEYIIIDGGSTDGTLNRISIYGDKISKIISEPDNGIYNAMNKGIKLASHDLIGLIHCGDYYEPGVLSSVFNEFIKTSADIIYGDINFLESNLDNSYKYRMKADHTLLNKQMSIYHPSAFVKRNCYLKYGIYNENYRIAADYDLFLNFYKKQLQYHYVPLVLANFRSDGISGLKTNLLIKENFQIRVNRLNYGAAVIYYIRTGPMVFYYSLRRFLIKLIIGKSNFSKLKLYFFRHWKSKHHQQ